MSENRRPFRFGVVAPRARNASEWQATARRLEAYGYSTLLLPDTTGPVLAPFAALGVAAGCTTTLHVGNWVLANDLRNPVLVAREAATLDLLSNGRFELGLGPGREDNDYATFGLELQETTGPDRLRRLGEALQLTRRLFAEEHVSFEGRHYKVTGAALHPPPPRQIPILVAASGPHAVRQAGRYADIVALGAYSRERLTEQLDWLREGAGDRTSEIERACYMFLVVEGDEAGRTAAAAIVRRFGLDLEAAIARGAPNVLVGSETAIAEQLQERRSTFGLSYPVVGAHDAERFAPIVRKLAGT